MEKPELWSRARDASAETKTLRGLRREQVRQAHRPNPPLAPRRRRLERLAADSRRLHVVGSLVLEEARPAAR